MGENGDDDGEREIGTFLKRITDTMACTFQASNVKLAKYSGNDNLIEWISDYRTIGDSLRWEDETRIAKLPNYPTGFAYKWYQVKIEDAEKKPSKVDDVFDMMKKYFLSPNHDRYLRQKMEKRVP